MSAPYLRLETRFLRNLNERLIEAEEEKGLHQSWLDHELHIISFIAPTGADFIGKRLSDLHWGRLFNVYIVKIRHHGKHIILPEPRTAISAGDKVYAVGSLKDIENFYRLIQIEPSKPPRTLKQFMETDYPDSDNALAICAVKVNGSELYAGKTLKNGNIRKEMALYGSRHSARRLPCYHARYQHLNYQRRYPLDYGFQQQCGCHAGRIDRI